MVNPQQKKRGGSLAFLRSWLPLWLQGRRRKRHAGSGLPVPGAPSNLQGEDLGGVVGLTWDNSGVQFEDGYSIEAKEMGESDFTVVGTADPDANSFQRGVPNGGTVQFRVRAFNASGFSAYSNVVA